MHSQLIINRVVLFCFYFRFVYAFCMRRWLLCVTLIFVLTVLFWRLGWIFVFILFSTDRSTDRIPKTWIPIPNSNRLKIKPWKLVADVIVFFLFCFIILISILYFVASFIPFFFRRQIRFSQIFKEWRNFDNSKTKLTILKPIASVHTGEGTVDEYPDISGITTAREAMRKMTEEDKQKIAQQVELFRKEKMTFDSEVAKWDDNGNDIIFLAKHMCMIMMEMTDFTR